MALEAFAGARGPPAPSARLASPAASRPSPALGARCSPTAVEAAGGGRSAAAAVFAALLGCAATSASRSAGRRRPRRRRPPASASRLPQRAAPGAGAAGQRIAELVRTEEPPDDLRERRLEAAEGMLRSGGRWAAPANDRLLRAARGEQVDRPPKWMMRQAGRYLPEYNHTLRPTDFFTVCRTPALAAEVTLQPLRRYPTLDAMIIFSDILVIPVAMGMLCRMEPDTGPRFEWPLRSPEDLDRLDLSPDVEASLDYVFDAIHWTKERANNMVPTIGFSGAPWTLMGYMVEGGAARSFDNAKKWLYLHPGASRKLLRALRDVVVQYLVGQYDAGAPLLQVFDTNCGELPPGVYDEFMVDDLKYIATEVKRQRPHALMSIFAKDGELATFNDSDYDVVGVSWKTSPTRARMDVPDKTLQGNLDPVVLYASSAEIAERSRRMVQEFGVDRYICNLGHGMMPSHPVEGPASFIAAVDGVRRDEFSRPAYLSAKPGARTSAAAATGAQ